MLSPAASNRSPRHDGSRRNGGFIDFKLALVALAIGLLISGVLVIKDMIGTKPHHDVSTVTDSSGASGAKPRGFRSFACLRAAKDPASAPAGLDCNRPNK